MQYIVNPQTEECTGEKHLLLVNRTEGSWVKIHRTVWKNVLYLIENNMDFNDKMNEILEVLRKAKMIISADELEIVPRLENITIQLTTRCNLKCRHCCATELKMEGDMSDELLKLVEQLCPCEITVSGGEPMLHPDFLEISKRMRERFQGELVLSTNGTLITEEIAKEIVKYYDKFEISLDGACAQETDSIRGKGVFEKVMKAVSILKKYGKRIALSAVILSNDEDLRFAELNKRLGTVPIRRELFINKEVLDNFRYFYKGGIEEYIEEKILEFKNNHKCTIRSCGKMLYQLFIDAKGNIYPCGGMAEDKFCMGSIKSFDKQDKNFVEQVMLSDEKYDECRKCNLRSVCWNCLSEIEDYSKTQKIFSAYCEMIKRKWGNL